MASEKVNALIEEIKAMSVLELSELVHEIEDVFGVSAAAAVAAAPAAGAAAAAVEEKTEFDVVMTSFGEKKINVIKEVRAWLRPRRRSRVCPPSSRSRPPRMRLRRSRPSWKLPAPPSSSSKLTSQSKSSAVLRISRKTAVFFSKSPILADFGFVYI